MRFRPISVQAVQALLTHFAGWAASLVERFIGRGGTMPHEICRDDRAGTAAVFTLDLSPHGKDAQTVARVRAAFGGKIPAPGQLFAFLEQQGLKPPDN
jgi:hypothetical protein